MALSAVSLLSIAAMVWCTSANIIVPNATATATDTTTAAVTNSAVAPEAFDGTGGDRPASSPPIPPTIVVYNSSAGEGGPADENRDSRFLSFALGSDSAAATNTLQEKQDEAASDPSAHLVDIYTDCLLQLSFPCVQRKLLLFLDKLGRMKGEREMDRDNNISFIL